MNREVDPAEHGLVARWLSCGIHLAGDAGPLGSSIATIELMAQEKRTGAVTKAERKARKVISEHDRNQSEAAKRGKTLETPNAVKQARVTIAAIDREKARTPGTPQHENRQRQLQD